MKPHVKITPEFKVGETIECKATGEKFKVLAITKEGNLHCEGRAGIMPRDAAQKPLTEEQKAELEADSAQAENPA